jgi:hypothetical protein
MPTKLVLFGFLAVAPVLVVNSVYAQNLPWCAIADNDGNTQCNFYTQQQCLQTLSGLGGVCVPNPAGNAQQSAPPPFPILGKRARIVAASVAEPRSPAGRGSSAAA